jgi:hypothetical protein
VHPDARAFRSGYGILKRRGPLVRCDLAFQGIDPDAKDRELVRAQQQISAAIDMCLEIGNELVAQIFELPTYDDQVVVLRERGR